MTPDWLWIALTLAACAGQTARNAAHRLVSDHLSMTAATSVRFVYGLPVAFAFWCAVAWTSDVRVVPDPAFGAWILVGAAVQIGGTVLMLRAMRERPFSVAIALMKTEPIQVALFSFLLLAETAGPSLFAAVVLATSGVLLIALPAQSLSGGQRLLMPVVLGLAAGMAFGAAAVIYRRAMLSLDGAPFLLAASTTLVGAMMIQTLLLVGWLALTNCAEVRSLWTVRRLGILTGVAGATASQCWFAAYALQSATIVSTLGLVEVLVAMLVGGRLFRELLTTREIFGVILLTAGAIAVLWIGA